MAQIKKDTSLRKAILQAAITGQLISDIRGESLPLAAAGKPSSATPSPRGYAPKTPNEFASFENQNSVNERSERPTLPETGKQLLDKIIEERNNKLLADWEEALKKNVGGKATLPSFASKTRAKKPAPVVASEIDEEELPFEIPENWCWCRLGDLVPFGQCENADPNDIKEDAWILDLEDIEKNSGKILQFKTKKEVDSKSTKHIFRKDYVLYSKLRPYLNKCVIAPKDGYCTSEILPLDFGKHVFNKYAQKFLMSPYFVDYTDSLSFGVKMPRLGTEDGKKALVPLPPLSVQKAILQEAITGKLTEQWRKQKAVVEPVETTESGKQLLDRIIEERNAKALAEWEEALKKNPKAKKPVPVVASEIEEDEIPFEVPESWCWFRLGDLGNFVRGSGIKRDETRSEGFPCIRYGEMYTRYKTVINETASFVDKNVFDKCQKIIKNDIAMALTGENEYDIALAAVYTGDKEIAMGGDMTRFRPAFVNSLFLVFALNSPYGIECKSELATGNIIVHISNDKLGSIMIPLPPLEEQEEIVKKLEELLPFYFKLEN